MSTLFFEKTRKRRLLAPPVQPLIDGERPEFTAERYNRSITTPIVEYVDIGTLPVANVALDWTGQNESQMVLVPVTENGETRNELVLVLGGYSK